MREVVVFIPGLMADARAFGPQIADLSRDFAVMCIPPTRGERVEEIASGMLDLLPKRCALVGHGLGGMVAMEIVRRAPDRVARLCLMDTSPLADTPQQAALRDPRIVRAKTGRLAEVLKEELPPEALAPGPYRKDILALVQDMATVLGLDTYLRQARTLQRRRDQQGTLRKIAVPTLVICGAVDTLYGIKRHSFMAELIPGAHLEVIEGAGHLPALEQPEVLADVLRDWLTAPLVLR